MAPPATSSTFYPGPQPPALGYNQGGQDEAPQAGTQGSGPSTLVAQDVNGTVYFYDASQIPTYPTYPQYGAPEYGMGMSPGPEGYYYNQPAPAMVPYPG